jgi:hypothetical protein
MADAVLVDQKGMADAVPVDSTGHALPPPVPAEELCLLAPSRWAEYWRHWRRWKKVPCCLCGRWISERSSATGTQRVLHSKATRVLNTRLETLHYCGQCRRKCPKCQCPVPDVQIKQRGSCEKCIQRAAQKTV